MAMNRTHLFVATALLSGGLLLTLANEASARPYRGGYYGGRANYGYYHPPTYYGWNHAPGWDWYRTYPYSAYNAYRNPYWYATYPAYTYPVYTPTASAYLPPTTSFYPAATAGYYSGYSGNPAPMGGTPYSGNGSTNQGEQVLVPHPSGELRAPPPDAAVIQLRLPGEFATVQFNGVATSSVGTTRWFVTPELKAGKDYHYEVSATFTRNGEKVTEDRKVDVQPGQRYVVDFTKPAAK